MLKSALFRGGLTNETLQTLLEGESSATTDEASPYDYHADKTLASASAAPPTGRTQPYQDNRSPVSDETAIDHGLLPSARSARFQRAVSYGQPESSIDSPLDDGEEPTQRVQVHDQRTILITNLSERTTHKDLVGIIRGGRLLDIFLRHDRSATVSFVEGAAEFLAYAKRKDIYLHTKRVSTNISITKQLKLITRSLSFAGPITNSMCQAMYRTRSLAEQHAIW